jgi:UDP-N-acetylmuramate dehydrogenase
MIRIESLALARGLRERYPLAPYTTWRIGGPARWFAEPEADELLPLLRAAREDGVRVHVLGRGSNVLVDSAGVDGLVIVTRNSLVRLEREGARIVADAGVSLPRLAKFAAAEGFRGFEFLVGIPGTVGGAVVINAGLTVYRPRETAAVLEDVEAIDAQLVPVVRTAAEIAPAYRSTNLLGSGACVVRARFRLEEAGDPEEIHRATLEHLAERKRKQPLDRFTAGSTFKQPAGGRPAGWYIEEAGLKGACENGARVSPKHANWIENRGDATSDDVRRLMDRIVETVHARFGVTLEPEVRFVS